MNPLFYIPIALYAYVALKYAWHVGRADGKADDGYFCFPSFFFMVIMLPIGLLIILSDSDNNRRRYSDFKFAPSLSLPKLPNEWDREKKRMLAERVKADLAVEQAAARTEHRAHLEKRQTELTRILDRETIRLTKEHDSV